MWWYFYKWIQDENNEIIGIKQKDGSVINISKNFKDSLKYKHIDLELYGKRIFNNEKLILPNYDDKFIDSIKLLKDGFITIENVKKRIEYLNNDFKEFNSILDNEIDKEYKLFTKEELDNLLNDCINYIYEELKKIGVINEE